MTSPSDMAPERRGAPRRNARGKRDPQGTREAILEAAGIQLAKDGPEGLSVSQVAQRAGVNRGTAYQHFQAREQLLEATTAWVSEKLMHAVFGKSPGDPAGDMEDPEVVAQHLADFAMENPELGRVWLFEVLSSSRPASDPFWNRFKTNFEKFAQSDLAQPGIDTEVFAVLILIGTFLWPVWARAHARSAKERQQMAKRFSGELLRLSLHGTMRPDKFAELDSRFGNIRNGHEPA
jgi:AcrR family transcriptional regulator